MIERKRYSLQVPPLLGIDVIQPTWSTLVFMGWMPSFFLDNALDCTDPARGYKRTAGKVGKVEWRARELFSSRYLSVSPYKALSFEKEKKRERERERFQRFEPKRKHSENKNEKDPSCVVSHPAVVGSLRWFFLLLLLISTFNFEFYSLVGEQTFERFFWFWGPYEPCSNRFTQPSLSFSVSWIICKCYIQPILKGVVMTLNFIRHEFDDQTRILMSICALRSTRFWMVWGRELHHDRHHCRDGFQSLDFSPTAIINYIIFLFKACLCKFVVVASKKPLSGSHWVFFSFLFFQHRNRHSISTSINNWYWIESETRKSTVSTGR